MSGKLPKYRVMLHRWFETEGESWAEDKSIPAELRLKIVKVMTEFSKNYDNTVRQQWFSLDNHTALYVHVEPDQQCKYPLAKDRLPHLAVGVLMPARLQCRRHTLLLLRAILEHIRKIVTPGEYANAEMTGELPPDGWPWWKYFLSLFGGLVMLAVLGTIIHWCILSSDRVLSKGKEGVAVPGPDETPENPVPAGPDMQACLATLNAAIDAHPDAPELRFDVRRTSASMREAAYKTFLATISAGSPEYAEKIADAKAKMQEAAADASFYGALHNRKDGQHNNDEVWEALQKNLADEKKWKDNLSAIKHYLQNFPMDENSKMAYRHGVLEEKRQAIYQEIKKYIGEKKKELEQITWDEDTSLAEIKTETEKEKALLDELLERVPPDENYKDDRETWENRKKKVEKTIEWAGSAPPSVSKTPETDAATAAPVKPKVDIIAECKMANFPQKWGVDISQYGPDRALRTARSLVAALTPPADDVGNKRHPDAVFLGMFPKEPLMMPEKAEDIDAAYNAILEGFGVKSLQELVKKLDYCAFFDTSGGEFIFDGLTAPPVRETEMKFVQKFYSGMNEATANAEILQKFMEDRWDVHGFYENDWRERPGFVMAAFCNYLSADRFKDQQPLTFLPKGYGVSFAEAAELCKNGEKMFKKLQTFHKHWTLKERSDLRLVLEELADILEISARNALPDCPAEVHSLLGQLAKEPEKK